jgi:hypothetical protein
MCYARPPANNDTTGNSVVLSHRAPLDLSGPVDCVGAPFDRFHRCV